jgi:hypothetical protein
MGESESGAAIRKYIRQTGGQERFCSLRTSLPHIPESSGFSLSLSSNREMPQCLE